VTSRWRHGNVAKIGAKTNRKGCEVEIDLQTGRFDTCQENYKERDRRINIFLINYNRSRLSEFQGGKT